MDHVNHSIRGHVAVITGASRGLGRVYAEKLASKGAIVVLLGRNAATLEEVASSIKANGSKAYSMQTDVTDQTAVTRCFKWVDDQLGRLDVLINNAGNLPATGLTWTIDNEAWWLTMDVHVRGSFLCLQEALRRMTASGGGRIVNIVSRAGIHRWPGVASYSVAKAAVIKLTENVAVEAQPFGVSVFAFHPGYVRGSGMADTVLRAKAQPGSALVQISEWFRSMESAGRMIPAEVSAEVVAALASGRYDFLSGRYITAEDDFTAFDKQALIIQNSDVLTMRKRELDWLTRKGRQHE